MDNHIKEQIPMSIDIIPSQDSSKVVFIVQSPEKISTKGLIASMREFLVMMENQMAAQQKKIQELQRPKIIT